MVRRGGNRCNRRTSLGCESSQQYVGSSPHDDSGHGPCAACGEVAALWPLDVASVVRGDSVQPGALLCKDCYEWIRFSEGEEFDA